MTNFPHRYSVVAGARPGGDFDLVSRGLPLLATAAPAEFDGPGDRWSPETLLVGAVAGCFILTFRAIARAAKLNWNGVSCDVDGRLERVDGVTQFTRFDLHVRLSIPATTSSEQARRALERAERQCLISNSLRSTCQLHVDIDVAPSVGPTGVEAA
jgi:organic hydroperoxide reductase OsmC/OhrA